MTLSRKPHGRLDNGYAISDLRKGQPLYNFGDLDRPTQRKRLPWEASNDSACSSHRLVTVADWVWQTPQLQGVATADPLLHSTDLAPCSNNSAVGSTRPGRHLPAAQPQPRPPPSNRELLERHLRQLYGSQLFRRGKYVAADQLGPVVLPPPARRSSHSATGAGSFQALRGRILGPVPQATFDPDDAPAAASARASAPPPSVFEWCDNANNRNNSAGCPVQNSVSRRCAKRIETRKDLDNWVYLHFRARRISWEFLVHEERSNFHLTDLYSEGVLDKWTVKLRFRVLREASMKFPMVAFLSRMGLDSESDIVFTTDGFFGDLLVGGLRNRSYVPHKQVSFNTTAQALGLQNGDSVFVVRASTRLRVNVETHMELARQRAADGCDLENDADDDEEEDEVTKEEVGAGEEEEEDDDASVEDDEEYEERRRGSASTDSDVAF